MCINRTSVELKQKNEREAKGMNKGINRTSVELKRVMIGLFTSCPLVLIAPVWN